jgi:glycosyltransferase involved in cell wall biosynthesis
VRSADSLAAAVNRFLELPHAARSEMGRQGRAKMERDFDEALVLRAYRSAIRAVTAAG